MERAQQSIGLMCSLDGETMILMILKDIQDPSSLIIRETICLFILRLLGAYLQLIWLIICIQDMEIGF